MKSIRRQDLLQETESQHSLTQYLMPYSYIPEQRVVVMADGSVSQVIECSAASCMVKSDTDLKSMSNLLAGSLKQLPENTTVQILVAPTSDISADLQSYLDCGKSNHPILGAIEAKKIEFFQETRKNPMFTWKRGGGVFTTKRFRVMIAVTMAPTETAGGVNASITDTFQGLFSGFMSFFKGRGEVSLQRSATELRFMELRNKLVDEVTQRVTSLIENLNGRGIDSRLMDIEDVITSIRGLLFPLTGATSRAAWRRDEPLSHQIPIADVTVNFREGYLRADNVYHRVASLSALPNWTYPGFLSLPQGEALNDHTILDYLTDGFLCISGTVISKREVRGYLDKREKFVRGGAALKEAVPELLEDIGLVRRWVTMEERNVFFGQVVVSTWDKDKEKAKQKIDNLREKLRLIKLDFRIEDHAGPSLFLQCLPGNFAGNIAESRRIFWMPDQAIADLMPVYGMGRGTKSAMFLGHNRMGEPVRYNIWESKSAHFVVVGATGSGKSFFVNNFVADFLRGDNTQCFFIDKGRSYAMLTNMLGEDGSHNNMGLQSRTRSNPCAGTRLKTSGFLAGFIQHLVTQTDKDKLTSPEISMVNEAIARAYTKKHETRPYTTYAEALEANPTGWFESLSKKMIIRRLDVLEQAAVDQARKADSGRQPEFTVYRIAKLKGMRGRGSLWTRAKDVDQTEHEWLASNQILLSDQVSGVPGVCVLYTTDSAESTMEMQGYQIEPLQDRMLLDAAREEDVASAVRAGVSIIYDDAFLAQYRENLVRETKANPNFCNASDGAVQDYVDHLMTDINPVEYFRSLTGVMVIQREVFLRDVAKGIADRLRPYHSDGNYASFFDGPSGFKLRGKRIVCFEMDELQMAGPHLLAAVVGSLLQMIILYSQEDDNRGMQKILVLEEFWSLLEVPLIREQVINLYRTARKFNLAVGCVSQLVTDFVGHGKPILDSSMHRFLLQQPPNVVKEVDKVLKYTPEQQWLLGSVASHKGYFSEILYENVETSSCDVMRLVSNPFFYWVATTNPKDVQHRDLKVKKFRLEGRSNVEAIRLALEECSREFPAGVETGVRA
jgi:hypothetical protein